MKADFFIDRPVFSTVLSIIIVIVGAIGLALLPVDQYPRSYRLWCVFRRPIPVPTRRP